MAPEVDTSNAIKSTWRRRDRSEWTCSHWVLHLVNTYHKDLDRAVPVHGKTDAIPHLPQMTQHIWVLFFSLLPVIAHQAWLSCTGQETMDKVVVFIIYSIAYHAQAIHEAHILRRLGHKYGFLDGDTHGRDEIPDDAVRKLVCSLSKLVGCRVVQLTYFSYSSSQSPMESLASWEWWAWLLLEIGLYGLVLDFWYYWYHRALHETRHLWKFHRTHHLTKHPSANLAAYAGNVQEFFDMAAIPCITYFSLRLIGLPLGFYDWWICQQYITYTEVLGHSGIRLHAVPPSTFTWLLEIFHAELVIEDHDLHHRNGWRKSHNYGKQTRLWDRLFGTCCDRVESIEGNVDYLNQAYMPLF